MLVSDLINRRMVVIWKSDSKVYRVISTPYLAVSMFSKARYRMIELENSIMKEIKITKLNITRRVFGVEVSFTCWENWLKI